MMHADAIIPLIVFMAMLLALSLYGLAASGHFPPEHRSPALKAGTGRAVLCATLGLAMIGLVAGVISALRLVPWFAAVIGGGAMVLAAPLILRPFPDAFVNGRGALVTFAGAGAALAMLLVWLVSAE
jgi:hypothetical protein